MICKKHLLAAMLLLQSVFSHAKPPAQHIIYFPNGERYVLRGYLMASYDGSNPLYSNSFEILQNELFANIYEEKRRFIFFKVQNEYKLKMDWFSGFIICVEGLAEIYENYKVFVFENGNLVREVNMNHNEYIELKERELELYKLTYNNEMDFWLKYFILACNYWAR
jgi:hypothetical protein